MRISDWSSDVCSSDLSRARLRERQPLAPVIPNPGNVKRPRTSPADSAARGKAGAAASAVAGTPAAGIKSRRSEEHTSELQSLMRISYAVFCLKKKNKTRNTKQHKRD